MNKRKKISIILSAVLISTISLVNTVNASMLEEDNIDDEMLIIDSNNIDDVDMENIITDALRVNARNAIAIDSKTKQVLFAQKADEIVPMASTTKILTALVAIKHGDLDREVTISKNASSIRGSKVGYSAGEKIAMRELLFGLMFKSGNDAAIAIAEDIGGSIEKFSNIMNDYAKSLGLVNSHFESPHGLDSAKHYTSAYDLAMLTATAMENEVFREICGEKTMTKDKYKFTRDYNNINKILYKIPNANGVKTGYTGQAGKCLVSSVSHKGRNIIIVVLNCTDRWNQTEKIYKYVEDKYDFKTVNSNELLKSTDVAKLGSIIEECEFDYGFKGDGAVGVEVFKPMIEKEKGEILGKIFFNNDDGIELLKKNLVCNKDLSVKEFERLIFTKEESAS